MLSMSLRRLVYLCVIAIEQEECEMEYLFHCWSRRAMRNFSWYLETSTSWTRIEVDSERTSYIPTVGACCNALDLFDRFSIRRHFLDLMTFNRVELNSVGGIHSVKRVNTVHSTNFINITRSGRDSLYFVCSNKILRCEALHLLNTWVCIPFNLPFQQIIRTTFGTDSVL